MSTTEAEMRTESVARLEAALAEQRCLGPSMTAEEAAVKYRVLAKTIRQRARDGDIRCFTPTGHGVRGRRYLVSDLDRTFNKQTSVSP